MEKGKLFPELNYYHIKSYIESSPTQNIFLLVNSLMLHNSLIQQAFIGIY